jgi:polyphosphate glucokinase
VARSFSLDGPIGCTFPAVVKDGVTLSAANVDEAWIGCDARALLADATGRPITVLNDADAAGIAEMRFGAGKGHRGVVIMLTLGTGIGSAVFVAGHLLPNTEVGHVESRGSELEDRASDRVREEKGMSWKMWAGRVDEALKKLEALFSPDLFIIGGGVSKQHDQFIPRLTVATPVVPAALFNEAGIIGAALAARNAMKRDGAASRTQRAATVVRPDRSR